MTDTKRIKNKNKTHIIVKSIHSSFHSESKHLRKNGNLYSKSNLVFGSTFKQMTVDTCNFHWMFILAFNIHDNIFKIFWFILSFLRTFSVSNFINFFFFLWISIKFYLLSRNTWKCNRKLLIYCYNISW